MPRSYWSGGATLALLLVIAQSVPAADPPAVALVLQYRPIQKGVDFETPDKADEDKCRVRVEKGDGLSGWVLHGPQGQVLRRFVDTNNDNVVDQWRYFNLGLETYRDIDSNGNNKVDQSRWLNLGGSKWGLDNDEDGKIDSWKMISAPEAARVAVEALVTSDATLLDSVLLKPADMRSLGLKPSLTAKIQEEIGNPKQKLRAALDKSDAITANSKWLRFDGQIPAVVPADDGKANRDLVLYSNAMAIVETDSKPQMVRLGEIVQVGSVWKLTQVPRPLEARSVVVSGGVLMQPSLGAGTPPGTSGLSEEAQKLLSDLQKLDAASPQPGASRSAFARYNTQRAKMLDQLIAIAKTEEDRNQWIRQLADGLVSAVQSGSFNEGFDRLKSLETQLARDPQGKEIFPYVKYRRLLAEYSTRLQTANDDKRDEAQKFWIRELEAFAKDHPEANDASDALFQLAMSSEFLGKTDEATSFYKRLASRYSDTSAGTKAQGAIRRLSLQGSVLKLAGKDLSGRDLDIAQYPRKDRPGSLLGDLVYSVYGRHPAAASTPGTVSGQRFRDRGHQPRPTGQPDSTLHPKAQNAVE